MYARFMQKCDMMKGNESHVGNIQFWFFNTAYLWIKQAATNPLSDCPGQLKILLGNQKFKLLCPNGQLKSKQGTECELKFCNYFWYFNRCVWHFISKQVEVDSFNLICRLYVPKRGCYKVLQKVQAIFHQILGSKVGHDRTIDLQCHVAPWGYLLRKISRGLGLKMLPFGLNPIKIFRHLVAKIFAILWLFKQYKT